MLARVGYTPRIEEQISRLGSKLPYREAAEELEQFCQINVSQMTMQRRVLANGGACDEERSEREIEQEVGEMVGEAMETGEKQEGNVMLLSADGCMVPLTNGEWGEVKTMVVGVVEETVDKQTGEGVARLKEVSTVTSRRKIRAFEELTTTELLERGVFDAKQTKQVVTVNDGAKWIQNLVDYHCPDAVRITDFRHAQSYLALAGKAVLGEGSDRFYRWYASASERLLTQPPSQTLARLRLLARSTSDEAAKAVVEQAYRYFDKRKTMVDYPHFRKQPWPIGSGAVESAHKQVVQCRLKQAGMRWKDEQLDAILSLRNLIVNDRWSSGWQTLTTYRLQQQRLRRSRPRLKVVKEAMLKQTAANTPLHPHTETESEPCQDNQREKWKPAPDHPWRQPFLSQP